jgi:hypothetical protein
MRRLFFLTLLFFSTLPLQSQIVISSCTAHDSIVQKYEYHAAQLALRRIYSEGFPAQFDEIIASESRDSVMHALIAVYNATSLPARDTVVAFDIYPSQEVGMRWINIEADSNAGWMQELLAYNTSTGNSALDDMIATYEGQVSFAWNPSWTSIAVAHIELNDYYNLQQIIETYSLDTLSGLENINLISGGLDSDDLYFDVFNGYRQLNYVHKWGDCPSGCTYSRTYTFNVYPDCAVEYVGSFGDPVVSVTKTAEDLKISVTNPIDESIYIFSGDQYLTNFDYDISSMNGQFSKKGHADNGIIDCSSFDPGIYFLTLQQQNRFHTVRVVKL